QELTALINSHMHRYLLPALFISLIFITACRVNQEPTSSKQPLPSTIEFVDGPSIQVVDSSGEPVEIPPSVPEELKLIWEAWEYLGDDYVDKSLLDPQSFSEEAIRGMLQVLNDPQTAYVSPEVLEGSFGDTFDGEFEGIGAHVSMNTAGKIVIVSPIPGGPAEKAGIKAGDIIVEVDGNSIEGLSLLGVVTKIRGPKGTLVSLLVKHLGDLDPVRIEVKRGVIPLTSVILRSQPNDRFAHIRISNFYPDTTKQLIAMVNTSISQGAEGLILDLRDNPGGPLNVAVELTSQFLTDGLVLYDIDGNNRKREWKVQPGGAITELPMVVLVNQNSASASEVVAGAIQDHKRAPLIGGHTFGKGSVNILRPLSNGGGLYMTVGHWYTPSGRLIQKDGLTPDIEVVSRNPREADIAQLRRAQEELELIVDEEKDLDS
ncbi:S41 family peptidase, partial [Dehalococcoidia bacterium]|nr:S41 family peptidase [Dehalococcoidia bacterium]